MASRRKCPWTGCSRGVEAKQSGAGKTKSSRIHMLAHKLGTVAPVKAPFNSSNQSRTPKSSPPRVERGISNQEWEHFRGNWRLHTKYWGLVQEKELVYNLWQCLSLS